MHMLNKLLLHIKTNAMFHWFSPQVNTPYANSLTGEKKSEVHEEFTCRPFTFQLKYAEELIETPIQHAHTHTQSRKAISLLTVKTL